MKFSNKNKKFTLIELIIVIVVIGILAGMALPKFMGVQRDAKASSLKNDCDVLQTVATLIETERTQDQNPYGHSGSSTVIANAELVKAVGTNVKAAPLGTVTDNKSVDYNKHLSKGLKTGNLTNYVIVTEVGSGSKVGVGTIIYNVEKGVKDGKDITWYGVDVSIPSQR